MYLNTRSLVYILILVIVASAISYSLVMKANNTFYENLVIADSIQ